jgi:SAM-dependent methyltransferase
MLSGALDYCSPHLIGGWIWNTEVPTDRVEVEIVCDDTVVGKATADAWRYDLASEGIGDGFHAFWFASSGDGAFATGGVRVRAAGTGHYLDRNPHTIPLPDNDLIFSVVGRPDRPAFLETGAADLKFIRDLLADAGMDWPAASTRRVLDWGCGCGRIARHWRSHSDQTAFFGCDINAKSIEWCTRHLTFGKFGVSGLLPPLPYPTAYFDVLYGISVLTHLLFDTQYEWMEELHRVLKPSGIAILTTHGPSIFPITINSLRSNVPGRTSITLIDEEMFFGFEHEEGSNDTGSLQSRGVFEKIFSPFKILAHKPRLGLMGIQDTYVLAKKSAASLSRVADLAERDMRGMEFLEDFMIDLDQHTTLTMLAASPGLLCPATVQLSLYSPGIHLPLAQSKAALLPDKISWTGLESAYAELSIENIPPCKGTAILRCQVNSIGPMDGAKLWLRQCALF